MSSTEIWNNNNELTNLIDIKYNGNNIKDVAIIIINRDRPDLTNKLYESIENHVGTITYDTYVIEMGSTKKSKYSTFWYDDSSFRGKSYGHNVGVRYAKARGTYKYYLLLMNDIDFISEKVIENLVNLADIERRLAIISPCDLDSGYAGGISMPLAKGRYHCVSQVNYIVMLIKSEIINRGDFLNPNFKYCWGATHELSYKVYKSGFKVAYADSIHMKHHTENTTFGVIKGLPSRQEYLLRAKQFASRYMVENYGKEWDKLFSSVLPKDVEYNTYTKHRVLWEKSLSEREQKLYNTIVHNSSLQAQIENLNPWFYPVKISGIEVLPGIGSSYSPEFLIERCNYRYKILVDEVIKRYNFKHKNVLDVASNCSYWSSQYAKFGTKKTTAIEGRLDYVKQGKLYWNNNKFNRLNDYEFIHANIMDQYLWDSLLNFKRDFVLCAGILYHVDNYKLLLQNCCNTSRDAILVDTRISDKETNAIQEPGGLHFDSIAVTSKKTIPTKNNLIKILNDCGFTNIEQLKTNVPIPKGMEGKDNYISNRRITLLAKRN